MDGEFKNQSIFMCEWTSTVREHFQRHGNLLLLGETTLREHSVSNVSKKSLFAIQSCGLGLFMLQYILCDAKVAKDVYSCCYSCLNTFLKKCEV